eukprot:Nitzschia sp. Nitz4//scaffold208_size52459//15422//16651//NITZ4_006809-RA/size52459-processed-gene-0.30-mRNA-1//-1//CDS//3329541648//8490//frame0
MPNTEEFRQHKKRQRHRNQERKQFALDELLHRMKPILSSNDALLGSLPVTTTTGTTSPDLSITTMYQPIPPLDVPDKFWEKVPKMCNPNAAVMDQTIVADASKFAFDQSSDQKLQRKLQRRAERGDITQEEKHELWNQHVRSKQSTDIQKDQNRMEPSTKQQKEAPVEEPSEQQKPVAAPVKYLSASRGQRKAWQVENFVALLQDWLQPGMVVIDFGSGSGNLCLALGAYFPQVHFVLVDKKPYPLQLVENRATSAGLTNIHTQQYTFSPDNLSDYAPPSELLSSERSKAFDLGIGLHCCGSFTDMVMEICHLNQANCIVCPCCNGGMVSQATGGYGYPRSTKVQHCLSEEEYLQQLSKSADDLQNYAAKCYVEYDRALWAKEHGFQVELWKMTPVECTPKHHVLYMKR